ncbi:MAG TPA: ABC transporter ATP-binding protein [Acidimicrobiales bacterium]|nr:ABC transporter ATP-binding protein [Acidimicrobiales bacterium]
MKKDVTADATVVLDVVNLVVHFPVRRGWRRRTVVRAVDDVSFQIHRGEIVALVGESGCGKSTIAMAVMRLLVPTSGNIVSGGQDLALLRGRKLRAARRRLQMIFQDPFGSLDSRQRVYDAVAEPLIIHRIGSSKSERDEMVINALDLAHLRPPERLAEMFPHELSGGQRQRVAIAAAMVMQPDLVVADEPVSMLDVSARVGILRLMMDLRDRLGISYLFITHDLATAWVVADRIAVVYLGRIVEIGAVTTVVGAPSHPYTRALLDVTDDDSGEQSLRVLKGETPSALQIPSGCRFHPRCPRYLELGGPDVCRTMDPSLDAVGEGGDDHRCACHFAKVST